jgi:hypothetical protein
MRSLEPVEPEIENAARLALHGHAEPAAHLPRLRRLAQLEAAQAADAKMPAIPQHRYLMYPDGLGHIELMALLVRQILPPATSQLP